MLLKETTFAQQQQMKPLNMPTAQKSIFVLHKGCYHNLRTADVLWVSSEGNYAHIYTKDKHYFNRISLANLLKMLPATMFRKVHKCFLVRVDAIDHIDRSNNELFVAGNKIPIGRSYKASLLGQLNLIG
ncbi:MAG: two-component system response regulator LytT [Polaribacter sp.]|jgi:two-component system response regulator LytT